MNSMRYFGVRYAAPIYENIEAIAAPVGMTCVYCDEPILEGEDGFLDSGGQALHRECFLCMIFGTVTHQMQACRCFKGDDAIDCEEGLTRRESARLALSYREAHAELRKEA